MLDHAKSAGWVYHTHTQTQHRHGRARKQPRTRPAHTSAHTKTDKRANAGAETQGPAQTSTNSNPRQTHNTACKPIRRKRREQTNKSPVSGRQVSLEHVRMTMQVIHLRETCYDRQSDSTEVTAISARAADPTSPGIPGRHSNLT